MWKPNGIKDVDTLRPRQDGRQLPDDIFKCIFFNENISISISLECVPSGMIKNIPALVQIMAWHRPGDKPLSEAMTVCTTKLWWQMWYLWSINYRKLNMPLERTALPLGKQYPHVWEARSKRKGMPEFIYRNLPFVADIRETSHIHFR